MTLLTLYMPLLIFVHGKVSVGHIVVGYAGLLLLGAAVSAITLFASALATSQVVAAILAAIFVGVMLLLWAVARAVDPPLNQFLSGLALHHEKLSAVHAGHPRVSEGRFLRRDDILFSCSARRKSWRHADGDESFNTSSVAANLTDATRSRHERPGMGLHALRRGTRRGLPWAASAFRAREGLRAHHCTRRVCSALSHGFALLTALSRRR